MQTEVKMKGERHHHLTKWKGEKVLCLKFSGFYPRIMPPLSTALSLCLHSKAPQWKKYRGKLRGARVGLPAANGPTGIELPTPKA